MQRGNNSYYYYIGFYIIKILCYLEAIFREAISHKSIFQLPPT
jgi:hypothetical protein